MTFALIGSFGHLLNFFPDFILHVSSHNISMFLYTLSGMVVIGITFRQPLCDNFS